MTMPGTPTIRRAVALVLMVLAGSVVVPPAVTADLGEARLDRPRATDAGVVSAGLNHTCAILADGSLWCWGRNANGQLGIGNTTDQSSPVRVGSANNWRSVSAGSNSTTCAVNTSNEVYCWGFNFSGQTGVVKTTTSVTSPTKVTALGTAVESVSVGSTSTCAITTSGGVWCWGDNSYGQLGAGVTIGSGNSTHTPTVVLNLPGSFLSVAVGTDGACALRNDNRPYCWGSDLWGQRGDGDGQTADSAQPSAVTLSGSSAVGLAAGNQTNCMILTTGAVRCWGQNTDNFISTTNGNMMSPRITTAAPFSGLSARMFSGGSNFACLLRSDTGAIVCGGSNTSSQVSNRPTATGFLAVTAGQLHACAIDSSRRLLCWGNNADGRAGNGTTTSPATPTVITFGSNASQILGAEPAAPSAPSSISVEARYRALRVTWGAPTSTGTASVSSYQHRRSSDGGNAWTSWTAFTSSEVSAQVGTITGLLDGVTYTVEVRAVSTDGNSPAIAATPTTTRVPCNPLIDCALGSVGPSGGIIVHDAGVSQRWDRFIEAAAEGWSGSASDPSGDWDAATYAIASSPTWAWNWSLPTSAQLVQIAANHNANPQLLADWPITAADDYWSSEEDYDSPTDPNTWRPENAFAGTQSRPKIWGHLYRPVRTHNGPFALAAPTVTATAGELSLTVNWTAPSTANNAPVSSYDTRVSSNGGTTYGSWESQGLATSLALTNLTSGASYRVQVRANNTAGAGASATTNTVTMTPTITPTTQTVTGTVNVAITDSSTFTTTNLDGAVSYAITAGTLPAGLLFDTNSGVVSGTPTASTSASMTITASGATSGSITTAVTFSIVVPPPGTVARVDAIDGLDGVTLEWFAPQSGEPATGYEYATSTDGGTTFSAFAPVPATISSSNGSSLTRVTTLISSGLTRGTETMFQVRAVNAGGAGPAFPDRSWMSTAMWDQWSPLATAKISDPCDPMNDCEVGSVGPGGGVIVYDHGSNATWGRYLEAAPAFWAGATGDPSAKFGCDGSRVEAVTGTAAAAVGAGATNTAAILAACSEASIAVRVVEAHSVTVGSTVVDDWVVPSQGDLNAMHLQRQRLGGWKYGGIDTDERNYVSSTDFHLSNFAGVGGSRWKAFNAFVRPVRYVAGPNPPSAPTVLVTTDVGRIDLLWSAPSNDGGNAVSDYELRHSTDGGSTWSSWTSLGVAQSHSITGLDPAADHMVEVRAVNRGGEGPATTTAVITPVVRQVSVTAGDTVSVESAFADGSVPAGTSYSITNGALPAGLSLDPATGVIAGSPTVSGTFTVTITATIGSDSVSSTIDLTVAAPPPPPAPNPAPAPSPTPNPTPDGSGQGSSTGSNDGGSTGAGSTSGTGSNSGAGGSTTSSSNSGAGSSSSTNSITDTITNTSSTAAPSTLVTPELQQQLTGGAGEGVIIVGGVAIDVVLLQVPEALRAVPPAERTTEQVTELRAVAESMLTSLQDVLGPGAELPIAVRDTPTGAVIVGLLRNPITGAIIEVPVEHVVLITGGGLVIMVSGGEDGEPARIGADGVLEIGIGGVVSVLAYGLSPGVAGEVVVMSTPRRIAEFAVDDDGGVATQAAVPTDLAPGDHTVVVTIGEQAASLGFRLTGSSRPVTTGASMLPSTGMGASPVAWVILVLAVGAFVTLSGTGSARPRRTER